MRWYRVVSHARIAINEFVKLPLVGPDFVGGARAIRAGIAGIHTALPKFDSWGHSGGRRDVNQQLCALRLIH